MNANYNANYRAINIKYIIKHGVIYNTAYKHGLPNIFTVTLHYDFLP